LGFTPSYVVGVWVGNNDGHPMNPYLASGLSGAAPIWNKIFKEVLNGKTNEIFQMPSGVYYLTDKDCGRSDLFIKGSSASTKLCSADDKKDKDKKKD
jgi:membrane peptidoglycan carboxypeptidase